MTRLTLTLLFTLVGRSVASQDALPVEPPIQFALYDARSRTEGGLPQLTLTLRSDRQYPTLGYQIDATTTIVGDTIRVELAGILRPSVIMNLVGPASYSTPLNLKPGRYELRIHSGTLIDAYLVNLGTETIRVHRQSGSLTRPPRPVHRLPPRAANLSCAPAGFSMGLCEDFLKLASHRIRFVTNPLLVGPETNPFRDPLGDGNTPDPSPQLLVVDLSDEQLSQLFTLAQEFTAFFRYAQYKTYVGIWRANGPGYGCYDGTCRLLQ